MRLRNRTYLVASLGLAALALLARPASAQQYIQNFDGLTAGTLPAGWSNGNPAGGIAVAGNFTVTTGSAISAPNAFGGTTSGGLAIYTALTSDVIQYDTVTHGTSGSTYSADTPMLCADAAGTNFYLADYQPEAGALSFYQHSSSGFTQIGPNVVISSPSDLTPLSIAADINRTASPPQIELYAWPKGGTKPASPSYTQALTGTVLPAGYCGFFVAEAGSPSEATVDDLTIGAAPATQTIYADDLDWVNSPYNINLAGAGASSVSISVNPGSYHRINVTGAAQAALTFNTATGANDIIDYRWDNAAWNRVAVAASVPLSLPSNTTAGVSHLLEWAFGACPITSDRWSSSPPANALQFTGLTLNGSASVSRPTVRPKKVLALGDSIREGQRTLAASGSSYPTSDWDATLSAAFALQDTLNAEVGVVGFSGQAVTNTTNSAVENVPALPSSYNLIYAGVPRVFTGGNQPDLLSICFGQNDGPNAPGFLAGLNAVVAGVGAKKTLIMGDENGYQTTAEQQVTGASFGTPGAVVTDTTGAATKDTYDGIHATATAQKEIMLPAETAAALPLLYPAGTGAAAYLAPAITHNASSQPVLTWPADSTATGYLVCRSVDGRATYQVLATLPASTLTYTDTTRPSTGTVYYHVVTLH